ncbi:hypothetical protein DICVIV_13316 [Dictyocaulus viviparus]|uniref:Uncharacterized protein n=1 Tax=Dictyocaulus viviparus TaxID=29172 RepID=A0A0D8XAR4_DICVI|nr:hypothetical protein DICVIV_13316 [Dictyocaulus viviparus]
MLSVSKILFFSFIGYFNGKTAVMALWHTFRLHNLLYDFAIESEPNSRGADWVHRELQQGANPQYPITPNQSNEVANKDEKFAVELGMLHIEPERMHIKEQKLTTDGQQKGKSGSD